jgi:hypothetical protein
MPVIGEESQGARRRRHAAVWAMAGALALLLLAVGLLPLTECSLRFGKVTFDAGREAPSAYSLAQGYSQGGFAGIHYHNLQIGSWFWRVHTFP